jgi:hydrogenase nickel incorporation protein HypA/HybF
VHELSVCRALIRQVDEVVRQHRAAGVKAIRLKIGPLSGVEPGLLEQAFPLASKDTVAEGARLVVERPSVRVNCQSCGADSDAAPNRLLCGQCGSPRTRLVGGDELLLAGVELAAAKQKV